MSFASVALLEDAAGLSPLRVTPASIALSETRVTGQRIGLARPVNPSEVITLQILTPASLPPGQSGLCIQIDVRQVVSDQSKVIPSK